MQILDRSIAVRIARPTLAFTETPEKIDTPDVQLNLDDKVSGEEPPDWSFLDNATAQDAPPASEDDRQGAPEAVPAVPPQNEAPEAATPNVPKVPITDPNEELPVPPVKPQSEEPMPDPQEVLAKKAEDAKAKEEEIPVKPEDALKPPAEVKLPTEEEVDAMQPKAGSSKQYQTDFRKFKEEVAKPALSEVKRLKGVVAELENRPAITPEVQAQLDDAKVYAEWYDAFMLENSPRIQKEFTEKQAKVEEDLFTMLRDHPRLKMSPEAVEKFKAFGLDSPEGIKTRNDIVRAVRDVGDEFLLDEVKDAFKARDNVLKEQASRIEKLKGQQGSLVEAKAAMEKEERMAWAKEADRNMIELVKDKPEMLLRDLPKDASPAQKLEVEAHNKRINEELVPLLHAGIRAIHGRDAKVTLGHLVNSLRVPELEKSLNATKAELAAAKKRVAELEGDGARMRRVASPSHIDSAPVTPAEPANKKSQFDMTAEEAADEWMAQQRR